MTREEGWLAVMERFPTGMPWVAEEELLCALVSCWSQESACGLVLSSAEAERQDPPEPDAGQ